LAQLDLFMTQELLSQEEKQFREKVRSFVENECMGAVADHFDKGTFPPDLMTKMAKEGLLGFHIDGYGCRRRSFVEYAIACEELGRCDAGLRAMFSVQNSLVMDTIYTLGSPAQKEKWLPKLARGEVIGCFCLSEPEAGSNPAAMTTRADPREKGFVLNGTKMWITNGTIAHLAIVWAKMAGEITGFLVETSTPGFTATPIRRKFSYRTSPTALINLDDCLVPEENLLPHARGLRAALQCLNTARFGVACGALGAATACYDSALSFATRRHVFDKPIASYQLVQQKLVNMALEITKAQLLTLRLGRLMDQGKADHSHISLLKLNNVRTAMDVARAARDILGARGILADNHVIRHLCDLEAISALEGTDSVHTLIVGKKLTGIDAFK